MKEGLAKILKQINNLNLKQKLTSSYFLFIIIPMFIFTIISYKVVSKTIEDQMLVSTKKVFEQTVTFLNYRIENIVNSSDVIISNQDVNDILSRNNYDYDIISQMSDIRILWKIFASFQNSKDILSVKIYVKDGLFDLNENTNIFSMNSIKETNWYQKLKTNDGKFLWFPYSCFETTERNMKPIISLVRLIRNANLYNEHIGVLRIDIPESNIEDILKNADTTKSGAVYLRNESGSIVSTSKDSLKSSFTIGGEYFIDPSEKGIVWKIISINNQNVMVGCSIIENTDWQLVSIIPLNEILSNSIKLRNMMFIIMFFVGMAAFTTAYKISVSSVKRIRKLINNMRKVQKGNLDLEIYSDSNDEIGDLVDNFNFMVERIKVLIAEQFKIGQDVKSAELRALQAQINPHFLYNTLDLVNWIALKNNVPDIVKIVQPLSKFYKISLNKGNDILSIRDELLHVSIYTRIQNIRFDNCINLITDIDENLYDFSILKITFQPIIENSIIHGILPKKDKKGTILIKGVLENNNLLFFIQDDGIGMSEEKVQDIFNCNSTSEGSGYGIKNVNNRIKLYYGSKFGLTYKSIIGQGTSIELRIPAIKHTPN